MIARTEPEGPRQEELRQIRMLWGRRVCVWGVTEKLFLSSTEKRHFRNGDVQKLVSFVIMMVLTMITLRETLFSRWARNWDTMKMARGEEEGGGVGGGEGGGLGNQGVI